MGVEKPVVCAPQPCQQWLMIDILMKRAVLVTDWFSVVEKHLSGAGDGAPYYAIECADYVTIVAHTAGDEIVLVRQFRPAVEAVTLELPSGHVEPGETAAAAVARELKEETGYVADRIDVMATMPPDTGRLSNHLICFFAQVRPSAEAWQGEPGLDVVPVPRSAILRSIADGQPMLVHAHCLTAIAMALVQGRIPA